MNQGYGNISWEFFVYLSYIFVAIILIFYITISIMSRKKSLNNMSEEGFFQNIQSENNPSEDSRQ